MKRRLTILLFIFVAILSLGFLGKAWLMSTDSGARWVLSRVTSSLDDQLSIGNLSGNLDEGLVLSNIRFAQAGLRVEIARVETTVGLLMLPLQLNIESLHMLDVSVWKETAEKNPPDQNSPDQPVSGSGIAEQDISVQNILADLQLPILIDMDDVEISGFNLRNSDNETLLQFDSVSLSGLWKDEIRLRRFVVVSPLLEANVMGKISLSAPYDHQWTGHFELLETDLQTTATGDFELSGLLDDYKLELQAVLETSGLPEVQLALMGQGGLQRISLDSLDLGADFLQASVSGVLDWSAQTSLDLEMDVARIEPAMWLTDWPDEYLLYGHVSVLAEQDVIRVKQFNLNVAGTEISVQGEALLDPLAGIIDGKLAWQNLGWPLGKQPSLISSDSGQLLVKGSPADWRLEGSLDIETEQYPGGSFELAGSGTMDSAKVFIDTGEALGGTLTGQAGLDWSSAFRWDAQLDVEQLDPGVLLSDWPVRLNAKLNLSQDTANGLFELQFDDLLGEFQGAFQGQTVTGHGGMVVDASGTFFKDIELRSSRSMLSLDGNPVVYSGLRFALDVHPDDWIADFLGGQVSGHGRVALNAPQPVLDIEFEASDLAWGETRIESLSISRGPQDSESGLNLRLEAGNLKFGDFSLQTAQVVLRGDRDHQTLNISLDQAGYVLATEISGAISDWNDLFSSTWTGYLQKLSLASNQQTLATLQDAASLTVSGAEISLGQACMDVPDAGGLCVESRWQPGGNLDFTVRLVDLSLRASKLLYGHDVDFTQKLDGEIQWTNQAGKLPSGRAAINISAGQFGNEQEDFDPVTTADGFFGFELANGNLTGGELDIPFPGIGMIDLDYAISGLALDGTGEVDGNIKINLRDISVLDELLPGLDELTGQLNIDLQVSGVTIDPAMQGSVSLLNAAADIPYAGTQLRQVSLQGKVNGVDNASLQGEFNAGDGHGLISMTAEYSDWLDPTMELTFSGSSLRMLNTSELRMDADTDLNLVWQRGEWLIDGEVVVRKARIAPATFIVSKVTESEDIRIVAGSLPYGAQQQTAQAARLNGQLKVKLGDEVRVDTDLAKLQLTGEVTLSWNGQVMPVANGNINGDGTLSVFGPKLHVRGGQVRFPGVLVNNPMLDIRAERDIFGNTQVRTAGVGITGSARRPVVEAYTSPLTTRDRAWAMLITGSDVDYGQGVGAFEVGAYIAPKLYLSYGISLFDDDNVVSARYDLTRRFGVKISSGQRENGVDLSYTIER